MIQITLTQALAFYSLVIGLGGFAIWLYTEVTVQRAHRVLEKQHLWRCIFCAYTYLDEAAETVSQCPRCGSYNAIEDDKAKFVRPYHRPSGAETETEQVVDQPRRNPSRKKSSRGKKRGGRRRR